MTHLFRCKVFLLALLTAFGLNASSREVQNHESPAGFLFGLIPFQVENLATAFVFYHKIRAEENISRDRSLSNRSRFLALNSPEKEQTQAPRCAQQQLGSAYSQFFKC